MRRTLLTFAAALSLAVCLWLMLASQFTTDGNFWLGGPFGDIGPFKTSHDSVVVWLIVVSAVLPLSWAVAAARRVRRGEYPVVQTIPLR